MQNTLEHIKAAAIEIPQEELEKVTFRVSVDEDGDGRAEAQVKLGGVAYTVVVDDFSAWDDDWDDGEEPGSAAFFERAARTGRMWFSKRGAHARGYGPTIYAHRGHY